MPMSVREDTTWETVAGVQPSHAVSRTSSRWPSQDRLDSRTKWLSQDRLDSRSRWPSQDKMERQDEVPVNLQRTASRATVLDSDAISVYQLGDQPYEGTENYLSQMNRKNRLVTQQSIDRALMEQANRMDRHTIDRALASHKLNSQLSLDRSMPGLPAKDTRTGQLSRRLVGQASLDHYQLDKTQDPSIERYVAVPINSSDHLLISNTGEHFVAAPVPTSSSTEHILLTSIGERLPPLGAANTDTEDTYMTMMPPMGQSEQALKRNVDLIEHDSYY